MRLFIAVGFEAPVKERLLQIQRALKRQCARANLTRAENLHLTLVFLGGVDENRVASICQTMDFVKEISFSLILRGAGRFRRPDGDIVWVGFAENPALLRVHETLCRDLRAAGFDIERRNYTPHLTLARQAQFAVPFSPDALFTAGPAVESRVAAITLMRSDRIAGRLSYTPVYETLLAAE